MCVRMFASRRAVLLAPERPLFRRRQRRVAGNLGCHAAEGVGGISATGRKAKWTVIIIGRFEGDKLAEDWVEYDRYNLFRQLEPH